MLTRLLTITLMVVVVAMAGPAWSYDIELAESYATLFTPVKGADAGKALHLISPDAFVNKVNAKELLVVLDVRTPAEVVIFTSILSDSIPIPINELFTKANLDRIPTDKTVVVLCKSGTRATAAGTALRHIGFENIYILKGGYKALVTYMGPKEANAPPSPLPINK